MENTTGITPVMPVGSSDGFGNNSWLWIIILLFFFWGGNNNNDVAKESSMLNQFNERDLFNINQNVSNSTAGLNTSILTSQYENAIGLGNIDKDILLGNSAINQNILLGNQTMASNMASCCCELKTAIHSEGEETRALITQNRIADLTQELNLAQIVASNQTQTQNILNSLGHFVPYSTYNYPYYGTTIQ